jgi:uncharacterized membrane protein HdeD (DUF308 family)
MDDLERTGNLIEAGFWFVFATAIAIGASSRRRSVTSLGMAASLISLLFGISDLVESRTEAWWRPWWLLAWKALCVAGLALCFLIYRRARNRGPIGDRDGPQLRDPQYSPQAPSSSM